ncbi:type III-B CRISPR module-associated Cmr3 family protein [Planctomicrobium sp. SH664]|uniref:type III-B CRISPR module-associated Cmr3 family protein n=1 Tax=Planctomicrobium sp. SH664 TaxID=3448125 RepID=UPI003F5C6A49
MNTRILSFTPVDAWFFRDGRPYHLGESGQTDVRSLFPPHAPTVIGTVRAALAQGQGWNGRGAWNNDLHSTLGNGAHNLGALHFTGPFVTRKQQTLLPVPLHLLGGSGEQPNAVRWKPTTFLAPSEATLECDLGHVRFPVPQSHSKEGLLKEPVGVWVTVNGYSRILRGEYPEQSSLFHSDQLWKTESRVGLARDHNSRAAKDGELYSPSFIRLHKEVKLATWVDGIPDDWTIPDLNAFGGESRLAHCETAKSERPLPDLPVKKISESGRFTVSLLTPLLLPATSTGQQTHPQPGEMLHSLSGAKIVSACIGKPIRIGGWNSVHREPEPLQAYLPAGSTWFCELARPDALDSLLKMHGQTIGDRKPHGLGQIAIGAWPTSKGDT